MSIDASISWLADEESKAGDTSGLLGGLIEGSDLKADLLCMEAGTAAGLAEGLKGACRKERVVELGVPEGAPNANAGTFPPSRRGVLRWLW